MLKTKLSQLRTTVSRGTTILFCLVAAFSTIVASDPTPSEILKKHAEAVGTADKRSPTKSRIAIGTSVFKVKLPETAAEGKAFLASNADNSMLMSSFTLSEYPYEKIGLFRGKVEVPFIRPGARSPIGSYIYQNDNLIKERIFGGNIFSTWAMLDESAVGDRVRFAGKKKVNGREAYVLRYLSKSSASANSSIEIFFDSKDSRHLRTEYRQTILQTTNYQIGIFGNQTGESFNLLTEDFDDYREIEGLMLPHKYEVKLLLDGRTGTNEFQWNFDFETYRVGQNFSNEFFKFDAP